MRRHRAHGFLAGIYGRPDAPVVGLGALDLTRLQTVGVTLSDTRKEVAKLQVNVLYPAQPIADLWHAMVAIMGRISAFGVEMQRGAYVNDSVAKRIANASAELEGKWGRLMARYRKPILDAEAGNSALAKTSSLVALPDAKFRDSALGAVDAISDFIKALLVASWQQSSDNLDEPVYNALGDIDRLVRDMGIQATKLTVATVNAAGDIVAAVARLPGRIVGAGVGGLLTSLPWRYIIGGGLLFFAGWYAVNYLRDMDAKSSRHQLAA